MQRSPKLLYVADVETPFVPATVDDLLIYPCNPEGRALFEAALEMIPSTFGANRNEANAFGAACAAASELLQTSGGKVTVFQSNLPSVGAGALKNRDESSVYNTDKEKFLYVPASPFYEKLATTSSERAVSFDLFVCSNSYVDIATIGLLASNTCGQVNYYHGTHYLFVIFFAGLSF
jgi:protein transport protein SEC24